MDFLSTTLLEKQTETQYCLPRATCSWVILPRVSWKKRKNSRLRDDGKHRDATGSPVFTLCARETAVPEPRFGFTAADFEGNVGELRCGGPDETPLSLKALG